MKKFEYNNEFFMLLKSQIKPEQWDNLLKRIENIIKVANETDLFDEDNWQAQETYWTNLIEGEYIKGGNEEITLKYLANPVLPEPKPQDSLMYENLNAFNKNLLNFDKYLSKSLSSPLMKEMHKEMYFYYQFAGNFKQADNVIGRWLPNGTFEVVYKPISFYLTPSYMEEMVKAFNKDFRNFNKVHQFILMIKLMFDFVSIHPFMDGNGRVSRMLIYWVIKKFKILNKFDVPMSKFIFAKRIQYYASLNQAQTGWDNGTEQDYFIINYMVEIFEFMIQYYQKNRG